MFEDFIYLTNFFGVIAFAYSGAVKGIRHKLDILGIVVLSVVTAVGGGIMRDIMLGKFITVFQNPNDIYLAAIVGIIVFIMTKKNKEVKAKILASLMLMDSIGLAIFTIIGASLAIDYRLSIIATAILATLTGVGGGVIRDILVGEIPIILKEDVYAVLSFFSSMIYYVIVITYKTEFLAYSIVFTIIIVTRILAIRYKLSLPK